MGGSSVLAKAMEKKKVDVGNKGEAKKNRSSAQVSARFIFSLSECRVLQ